MEKAKYVSALGALMFVGLISLWWAGAAITRDVASGIQVRIARAQTVAVQHATSTAISANMPVKITIVAAYPEATEMNADAQGIPASEAQPIQVEPIDAPQIPVTYAPITIIPPRSVAVSTDGVVEALGVYRTETTTPSATAPIPATDTPIPFPTHEDVATVDDLPIIEIVPTETIQPTVTLEPSPERMPTPDATETPRPTSVPEPTITPVPVVVVTDTPAPTVEPSATATSVLQSPIATPTREATATP